MIGPVEVPMPPAPPPPPVVVPSPPLVTVALYRDKLATDPIPLESTWEEFADFLVNYVEESPCTLDGPTKCVGKDCPHKAFSSLPPDPEIGPNPMAWSPVVITGKRLDKNVQALTLLSLDFDHVPGLDELRRILGALQPYEHVLHTTHSHRADDMAFRAVLALSRPVPAGQWHRFLAAAVAFLGVPADPVCKNRSRLYYRPSHPKGAPHSEKWVRGKVLDVDTVLAWGANLQVQSPPAYDNVERILVEGGEWDLDSEHLVEAISLMANYFPPRRRNELCLALAGMLRAHGATRDDAFYVVREICVHGGSEKPDERAKTVDHTYGLDDASAMTGLTRVADILAEFLDGDLVEATKIAKEFGDHLTDAANEAFKRLHPIVDESVIRAREAGANGVPLPPPPPTIIDLGALKEEISSLANKRARALERDECIGAVLLRRVLNGEPLARAGGIGDVETVREGAASGVTPDEAVASVMGMLAFALPETTTWDAVVELVRLSLATLPVEPGEDPWLKRAEKLFDRSQTTRRRDAVEKKQAEERRVQTALETFQRGGGGGATPPSPPPPPPPGGENWKDELVKRGDGTNAPTFNNVQLIFENDDNLRGTIRWNEHDKRIDIRGGIFARYAGHGEKIIATAAQNFLASIYGIQMPISDVQNRLMLVARDNSFDPLADYLRSLKWDGVSRIDTMLVRYFGAKDTEHVRRISRRWCIGAIARGFDPGCKFDNVIVFEGLQGARKTSAFEALGGDFYCSTEINIRDKDAKMLASCSWIVELAEMEAVRRNGTNSNKAFFTARSDKYRPPFGVAVLTAPRRCVFVGTTNEHQYLSDPTGHRRWWPVRCGEVDLPSLLRDRDQLWAEAVAIYLEHQSCSDCAQSSDTVQGQLPRCAKHRWWLDKIEEQEAATEAGEREEEQPWMAWHEKILAWWRSKTAKTRPTQLTVSQVAMEVGEIPVDRVTRSVQTEVGIAMTKLGFVRVEAKRIYVPSAVLLNMPTRAAGNLFVVPGGKTEEGGEK